MHVVVVDNGTGFCKAGFAGDTTPKYEFPSIVGKPRYTGVIPGVEYRKQYVGGFAQGRRGVLSLSYPIRKGIIQNWNDLEKIWEHTFYHLLEIDPRNYAIVVSEAPKNPLRNREKMVEILFEKFGFRGVFVAIQAVLALYTFGNTTGLVLDSGDGITHAVPVYEGYAISHAITRIEYAGRVLTDYLSNLLTERGYYFTTTAEVEIVREIKEQMCFVSDNFMRDMKKKDYTFEQRFVLPDGHIISVGSERFRCPELLFQPSFINLDNPGFQGALYDAAMKCDIDLRRELLDNVVLSGGNTMFPGLRKRLQNELDDLSPCKVRVYAPPDRTYSVWEGGSILGSLPSFGEICINRSEYDEVGSKIVHRKCF